MSTFYRQFLLEDARSSPRAHLAAFGKHPGWNDHIDDLGLETASLILAKQTIYLEGLSSQIDTAAWEKVGPGGLLEDYDHVFHWQRGLNTIVGSLVASRDGKGRTRYPMIVCAQLNGATPARVWRDWWPVVERALQDCRAATTAAEVVQILDKARGALRRATADATPLFSTSPAATRAPASLAGQAELGPANEGLHRLLYQVSLQLEAWAPGRVPAKLDADRVRSVHLRLPQVYPAPPDGLQTWSAFFTSQLDPGTPRLLLWPRTGTWFDVIVGRPAGADFFCLRANARTLPCTTDVPFTLDDSFRARAQVVIDDLASQASPRSIFDRAVAKEAAARRKRRKVPSTHSSRRWWWFSAVVGVAAVAAGTYAWKLRQTREPREMQSPAIATPPTKTAAESVDKPSTSRHTDSDTFADTSAPADPRPVDGAREEVEPAPTDVVQAWSTLCWAYDGWVGSLQQALADPARRQRWAQVSFLQANVLAPFDDARPRLGDLDPRTLAGVTGDLRTLTQSPPSTLRNVSIQQDILTASRVVVQVGNALREWTILTETRERAKRVKELGWPSIAQGIAFPDTLPFNDRLALTIDRVVVSWNTASSLAELGASVLAGLEQLELSGDPELAQRGKIIRQRLHAVSSGPQLERDLGHIQDALTPVLAVLSGDWQAGAIDNERFIHERGGAWGHGLSETELLKLWIRDITHYTATPAPAAGHPIPATE